MFVQSVGWNKVAGLLPENGRRLVCINNVDLVNLHPYYTYKVLQNQLQGRRHGSIRRYCAQAGWWHQAMHGHARGK